MPVPTLQTPGIPVIQVDILGNPIAIGSGGGGGSTVTSNAGTSSTTAVPVQSVSGGALALDSTVQAVTAAVNATLAGTQPISAASLPLPTNAATSALQSSTTASIVSALATLLKVDTVVQAVSTNRGASVGTTAVTIMPANAARRGFSIQNQSSSAVIYLSGVGSATADYNSLMIPAGGYYETPSQHAGTGAISIISNAASTPVYAREW